VAGAGRATPLVATAATVTILAAIGGWAVARHWPASIRAGRHPELASADPDLVVEIASLLRGEHSGSVFGGGEFDYDFGDDRLERLRAVLDRDPAASAPAALRVLCDKFGDRGTTSVTTSVLGDETQRPVSSWLRDHPTPETDRVLLRIVADRNDAPELRDSAVIALCRQGNAAAVEPLARVALDDTENEARRVQVVQRFWRIGVQPPERMHGLLCLPSLHLAQPAAASLALSGDPEAPTLVVDGLRRGLTARSEHATGWLCAKALQRVVEDDDLRARLAELTVWFTGKGQEFELGPGLKVKPPAGRLASLPEDVAAWLAAHPAALATEFERARAAYRGGERRRLEMSCDTMERVVEAGDEVDLAAALLLPTEGESCGGERLEQLDRLARLVRLDAGEAPTPARWIDALNRRLLCGPRVLEDPAEPAELWYVMAVGFGDDVGLSALCLAVADRLGLPIVAMASPDHVFVRWDDGTSRRNIECFERGAEHDDAWYAARAGAAQPVSRRQFVAIAVARRARLNDRLGFGWRAGSWADWAVKVAPDEPSVRMERARIAANWKLGSSADALDDVRAAEASRRLSPREAAVAARVRIDAHEPADALATAEAALAIAPESVDLRWCRARALIQLRRFDEARAAVADVRARAPGHAAAESLDVVLAIALGDDGWKDRLEHLTADPVAQPDAHLEVAFALLDGIAGAKGAPRDAAAVLDRVRGLVERGLPPRNFSFGADDVPDLSRMFEDRDVAGLRLRLYHVLRFRCCAALDDEAGWTAATEALKALDAR
jgi:hypothetical protein